MLEAPEWVERTWGALGARLRLLELRVLGDVLSSKPASRTGTAALEYETEGFFLTSLRRCEVLLLLLLL